MNLEDKSTFEDNETMVFGPIDSLEKGAIFRFSGPNDNSPEQVEFSLGWECRGYDKDKNETFAFDVQDKLTIGLNKFRNRYYTVLLPKLDEVLDLYHKYAGGQRLVVKYVDYKFTQDEIDRGIDFVEAEFSKAHKETFA